MIIMYSLASLPLIYVYSFNPKSELTGFINFFVVNVVVCFLDMVLAFMALFSQGQSPSTTVVRVSRLSQMTNNIRWVVAVVFPTVNFKRALFNIRLKSSQECISAVNSLMLTNYSYTEPGLSLREPGVGILFRRNYFIDILSIDNDFTRCRFQIIDQHSKCGGFTCTIRPCNSNINKS